MSFLEEQFPICPSLGMQSAPSYLVDVVRMQSGVEKRNRYWSRPLYRYTVSVYPRLRDEVQQVLEFWHAVGGRECGFRFKDYVDFKSCRTQNTPTPTDQPLVALSGSPSGYQLTKRYTFGSRSQDREIYKPVDGTIRIANQAGVEQGSGTWDLDPTTGILLTLGGFSGVPTTWGGEFDVPVRFDSMDLPITLQQYDIHGVSFTLTELRL